MEDSFAGGSAWEGPVLVKGRFVTCGRTVNRGVRGNLRRHCEHMEFREGSRKLRELMFSVAVVCGNLSLCFSNENCSGTYFH